ncbi:MAG TPA: ATP-binding cassette domain-containing protein [Mycobacterium sp.]|nr:ATP-binding cassette domain-containing protein [Mycobacterium sp.]
MTRVLAFDPLGPAVPVTGTIILVAILLALLAGYLVWPRRGPAAVHELSGVAVATHQVSKEYVKGRRVVDDVSFQICPGRVVGLLGPNGAGKTTLLGMITGLITPTAGDVYLFGHHVQPGSPVLSRVGIALEQPGLIPHLTGLEALQTTWAITGRPEKDAHFDTVASLSGLGDALRRKVSGYSLGMRQRLALAQAMLGLPDLLLLDEPANGLDPAQVRQLRKTLRDYAASGRTVMLSSHVLSEVEKICDEILVLHNGRLALSTTMDDIPRTTMLRLDLGDEAGADAAEAALTKGGIIFRRTADDSIEVTATEQCSVTTVLRSLVNGGCEVRRLESTSTFEDAYYAAVSGGRANE